MTNTLFLIFFKLGFFSFGGGYTMIPLVEQELLARGLGLSPQMIANIAAIAGVAPGPVGINLAIAFGYELAGLPGVLAAALGVMLPSLILVLLVAIFFKAVVHRAYFHGMMTGLKPCIVGITLYAAIAMIIKNDMVSSNLAPTLLNLAIAGFSFLLLMKTRLHPFILICGGAIAGLLLF